MNEMKMPKISVANPDRDWPSVVATPILDVPLRDTAILRGPDRPAEPGGAPAGEVYYLTGTLQGPAFDKTLDFDNARQIKLWKSENLKKWEEIGTVWDLDRDVLGPRGDEHYRDIRWMRRAYKNPSCSDSPVCMGFCAPELHYIVRSDERGGDWFICFSMNNEGTGLLKSVTGKPEGPYEAWAHITLSGGHPSMFQDDPNEQGVRPVYWLFGNCMLARLTPDLRSLAESPQWLRTCHQAPTAYAVEKLGATLFRDYPLTVGDHGAFLFKNRGRYYLTAARRTNRFNAACHDTFVAWSDTLSGPYSEPTLMVPHGGCATVFQGPPTSAVSRFYYPQQTHYLHYVAESAKSKKIMDTAQSDAPWYATFCGDDSRAIFRDRPAFIPLEWTGPERWEKWEAQCFDPTCESVPRKPQHVFTERGPWPWMKPLVPGHMRDVKVCPGHDGCYYFSGSALSHPGKLMIWKSSDLARWETLDPVWSYEQIEWLPEKRPYTVKPPEVDRTHVFWHTWVTSWNDTFYITFSIFGDPEYKAARPDMRGVGALRSVSGRIEGPYETLGKVGGQVGYDPEPWVFQFFDVAGKLYCHDFIHYKSSVAEARLDEPGWKWEWKRVNGLAYEYMQRGDLSLMESMADRPVFVFHSSGRIGGGAKMDGLFTYDVNIVEAESPWGPPRGTLCCIPHAAAANRFQDRQGYWWSSMFGADQTGPWWARFGLIPLRVDERPDGSLFVDVEDRPDDYQKRIMGGGSVAEVITVTETLSAP